ncbi:MAG: RagB/SusD family nutrient uptake outer membrane protein [Bacteroidales bacterium]|nr:RagB/SusD family nutrient uptake outer membrane protein [Bacteroidales bacterium]MBN2820399.1 RagB/SusD family nutrient uptake outer membrane protein [Bacteroidales bacterium]
MNIRVLKYVLFLLSGIALTGCSSDFLDDIKPQAAENSASFYLTQDHAEQAIIAAYSQFNNIGIWDVNILQRLGDIPSDDAEPGGEDVTDCPNLQDFGRLTPLTTEGIYNEVFGTLYRGIYFSNIAIEEIPGIIETDPEADPEIINRRVAEAKFLRAINYFYLTMIYGGVPLVDHVLGASEFQQPRADIKEIYNLIEQDLKDAIAVLPERSGYNSSSPDVPGEYGRASKGAAQALLGRLYLHESSYAKNYGGKDARFDGMTQRWGEALQVSEEVINSGEYELLGINGETYNSWRGPATNGYRYIFTSDGDNSKESVFEIQCVQEQLGWSAARGNALAQWSASRYYYADDGAVTTTGMWGFGVPTQAVFDAFEPGDPRLESSMAWEGGADSMQTSNGKWVPYCFDHCITKIYSTKWEASSAEFKDLGGPWHGAPQNIPLIRFSEVYLNAAEAAFESGNTAKALEYVNKVRERARMCGTTGVPAALTAITLEDIQNERRIEFTAEGKRFYDIVRWGLAADLLNKPTLDGFDRKFVVGKHEFHPLPEREVYLSGGKLEQYPGW